MISQLFSVDLGQQFWVGISSKGTIIDPQCMDTACDSQPIYWDNGESFTFDSTIIKRMTWLAQNENFLCGGLDAINSYAGLYIMYSIL